MHEIYAEDALVKDIDFRADITNYKGLKEIENYYREVGNCSAIEMSIESIEKKLT